MRRRSSSGNFRSGGFRRKPTRSVRPGRPDVNRAWLLLEGPQATHPGARRRARLPVTCHDDRGGGPRHFLKLMAMDDAAFGRRSTGARRFARLFPAYAELVTEERGRRRAWRDDLSDERAGRADRGGVREPALCRSREALCGGPKSATSRNCSRPSGATSTAIWYGCALAAGTCRATGHRAFRPSADGRGHFLRRRIDPFRGGAYRLRRLCFRPKPDRLHADLGSVQHYRRDEEKRAEIEAAQKQAAAAVDDEITRLGIEHDANGNRAKAYLYCLETRCPKTGWMVPMAPTWAISKTRNVVASWFRTNRQTLRH